MSIQSFLKGKAEDAPAIIVDQAWIDKLAMDASTQIVAISNPYFRAGAQSALDSLLEHKDDLVGMAQGAVGLMIHQLAIGDTQGAQITYITEHASTDDLIDGMNADTDEQITEEKKRKDLEAAALKFAKEVGMAAATHLLPFILTLII